MSTTDVEAAAFLPTDGYIDPASVTQAIAKGARMRGATICEHTPVTSITVDGRRCTTVHTADGDAIECEMVVNAAGMWGMEVGRLVGARVPAVAVEHQYLLSGPIEGYTPVELGQMPTMRDPDHLVYYKPDGPGLLVGGYEPDTIAFGVDSDIPSPFQRRLFDPNFDRFAQLAELAQKRTPVLEQAGIRSLINGPIPYSADADFVMGRVPELDNFYVATGFLYGIAAGGGAGKMMAEWMLEGRPSLDLWPLDVRRFSFHHTTTHFLAPRMVELYGHHYKLAAPGLGEGDAPAACAAARCTTRSPRAARCSARAAAGSGRTGSRRLASSRSTSRRSPAATRGSTSAREATGGAQRRGARRPDELRQVRDLRPGRARRRAVAVGRRHGQVDRHRHLHPAVQRARRHRVRPHDGAHRSRHLVRGHRRRVRRPRHGVDPVAEPDRRQRADPRRHVGARRDQRVRPARRATVLQAACEDDVSNAAFRYGRAREITIGAAPVLALRIGYTGELGWELHVPSEYAAHVYEVLRAAGEPYGIVDVGYRAIDRLRVEKGYVYWSTDVTPDTTPLEAGLEWRIDWDKGDFCGRDALVAQRADGRRRAGCARSRSSSTPGRWPTRWAARRSSSATDAVVGFTTTANFGHAVGKPVAYGYLPIELLDRTDFTIEVYGEPFRRHPPRRARSTTPTAPGSARDVRRS